MGFTLIVGLVVDWEMGPKLGRSHQSAGGLSGMRVGGNMNFRLPPSSFFFKFHLGLGI